MKTSLLGIFRPPIFPDDEQKTGAAATLGFLVNATIIALLLTLAFGVTLIFSNKEGSAILVAAFLASAVFSRLCLGKGNIALAGIIFLLPQWIGYAVVILLDEGIKSPALMMFPSLMLLASVVFGKKGVAAIGLATVAYSAILALLARGGIGLHMYFPGSPQTATFFVLLSLYYSGTAIFMHLRALAAKTESLKHELSERLGIADSLKRQTLVLEWMTKASAAFINMPLPEMESAIRDAMGQMAEMVGADRVQIFSYDPQRQSASATHEWCREGIQPTIGQRQELSPAALKDFNMAAHLSGEAVSVPDVNAMPEGKFREMLLAGGTRSVITMPLLSPAGYSGLASFAWVGKPHVLSEIEKGLLKAFANILMNVRQRKEAFNEAAESRAMLNTVVENTPDLIWFVDPKDFHQLTFNRSSHDYILKMTGRGVKVGDSLEDIFGTEYAQYWRRQYLRARDEGSLTFEQTSPKSGRTLEFVFSTVKKDGLVFGISGIARDITERRRIEEKMRQSQQMEAMGRMAAGVAHDFNNLLSVILGYTDLELTAPSPSREETEEHLKAVLEAGNQAKTLASRLLAFSRRQVLKIEVLELNKCVADGMKMINRLLGRGIKLVLEISGPPLMVSGDCNQIEMAVMNLCVNARDAMENGVRKGDFRDYCKVERDDKTAREAGYKGG